MFSKIKFDIIGYSKIVDQTTISAIIDSNLSELVIMQSNLSKIFNLTNSDIL